MYIQEKVHLFVLWAVEFSIEVMVRVDFAVSGEQQLGGKGWSFGHGEARQNDVWCRVSGVQITVLSVVVQSSDVHGVFVGRERRGGTVGWEQNTGGRCAWQQWWRWDEVQQLVCWTLVEDSRREPGCSAGSMPAFM